MQLGIAGGLTFGGLVFLWGVSISSPGTPVAPSMPQPVAAAAPNTRGNYYVPPPPQTLCSSELKEIKVLPNSRPQEIPNAKFCNMDFGIEGGNRVLIFYYRTGESERLNLDPKIHLKIWPTQVGPTPEQMGEVVLRYHLKPL